MSDLHKNEPVSLDVGCPGSVRRLVSVEVVAKYLDLAPDTIYTMVSQRRIPFVKMGRLLRFDLTLIDAWVAKNTTMPMLQRRP